MRAFAIRAHGMLSWLAIVSLLMWGLSGLLHPVMSLYGVQQAVFMPPQRALNLQDVTPLRESLLAAGIEQAVAVKVVVSASENLLQATVSQDEPRRYFRLSGGTELPGYDAVHAVFLARHYMGIPEAPVRTVEFVTEFSDAYPSVNRLLPVYRVRFERDDDLTAYVYTETNALASVSDRNKQLTQTLFQWFHTWSWLPRQAEAVRVLVLSIMSLSLLAMSVSGLVMLVKIRRPQRAPGLRGWHRIAGYALVLPFFMLSFSGLFHLVQYAWDEPVRKLTLSAPLEVRSAQFSPESQWAEMSAGMKVNAFSLVTGPQGQLLYRLGLMADPKAAPGTPQEIRNARFDGVQPTGPAVYLDAADGKPWKQGDRELALHLGERFTGQPASAVRHMELVTRFGPGYDFRNKRLPVWRLDYAAPVNATVFVDTTTGVLADKTEDFAKPERFSFSFLHKWNFLVPLGRDVQNIAVISVVSAMLVMGAGAGSALWLRRRKRLRAGLWGQSVEGQSVEGQTL